jgi:predicted permease
METVIQDLRFGLRMLWKKPGFTLAAIITLALGIGANTAIFSVVNFILLRPLPVKQPRDVSFLSYRQKGNWRSSFTYPEFQEIRNQAGAVFSDAAALELYQMEGLRLNDKSETLMATYVSGNFFDVLGLKPALGRLIQPGEGKSTGADPVLVLGYSFWKSHFNGDPGIVGKHATISGRPVTVVGIAPPDFRGVSSLLDTQGYLPLSMVDIPAKGHGEEPDLFSDQKTHRLTLIGRLKDGLSLAQAQPALAVVAGRLAQLDPANDKDIELRAQHLDPLALVVDTTTPLPMVAALFLILAGLVLVLACLNVANLFLVRATARRREMAVRAALGAARWRLVRQLLTESLALALLGCGFGVLIGTSACTALSSAPLHTTLPIVFDFSFDWRVFLYAFGVALFCTVVVGIVPALRASRPNLNETLRENTRTASGARQRLRSLLVVAQVAGSLTLLIVTGLFVRSLRNVERADLGFDPGHVLNLTLNPRQSGMNDEQARNFYRDLLDRAKALPGVQCASLAASVPFGYNNYDAELEIDSFKPAAGRPLPTAGLNMVSPGYFETMRIPILRGRAFLESDKEDMPKVAVINETMAQRYWPKEDPIGKKFTLHRRDATEQVEIVGISKNSKTQDLAGPITEFVYRPIAQSYVPVQNLQVRTWESPEGMTRDVINTIHSMAPGIPVFDVQTMTAALSTLNGLLVFRLGAWVAACMGGLGLVLAIVGVYGVLSYASAQRTQEIGIRMALGASRLLVLKMILRQGMVIVVSGLFVGILAALGLAKLLSDLLVDVTATDPATFAGVSLLLAMVALLTCYIPARRAAKMDPMVALRYE